MHTVVAWDFAMAIAPMWHSTIFGPYFVTGAIFSGIAALILVMASLRKVLHLEGYLTPHHFNNLSKLLLLMSLLWLYFTFAENLTVWYGNDPKRDGGFRRAHPRRIMRPYFWTMVFLNFVVPFVLLGIRRLRTITTATIASVCVVVGMWLERFIIVVPTLANPRLNAAASSLFPHLGGNGHHRRHLRRHGDALHDLRASRSPSSPCGNTSRTRTPTRTRTEARPGPPVAQASKLAMPASLPAFAARRTISPTPDPSRPDRTYVRVLRCS